MLIPAPAANCFKQFRTRLLWSKIKADDCKLTEKEKIMTTQALYDVLTAFQDIHKIVINHVLSLSDEQLRWKPQNYSTSIGFHAWHLARESDFLKAAILQHFPQIGTDFGEAKQIWHEENLTEKWDFPAIMGDSVGTGLSDEIAGSLPIPPKEELLDYLRRSYAAIEAFLELLDTRYAQFENGSPELRKSIELIRLNVLVFLLHDARHLGMMECLKGLQTGFGSATEKRE